MVLSVCCVDCFKLNAFAQITYSIFPASSPYPGDRLLQASPGRPLEASELISVGSSFPPVLQDLDQSIAFRLLVTRVQDH